MHTGLNRANLLHRLSRIICIFLCVTAFQAVLAVAQGAFVPPISTAPWTRFARLDTNGNGKPDENDEPVSAARNGNQLSLVSSRFRPHWVGQTTAMITTPHPLTGRLQTGRVDYTDGGRKRHIITGTVGGYDVDLRPTFVNLDELTSGDSTYTPPGSHKAQTTRKLYTVQMIDDDKDGIYEAFSVEGTALSKVTFNLVKVDVNNDGRPDFVTIPWTLASFLAIRPNQVPQVFIPLADTNGDGIPDSPAFDFDNDGKPDPDLLLFPAIGASTRPQQQLYFAHFGNGAAPGVQLFSQIMLLNPNAQAANAIVSVRNDPGQLLNLVLNGEAISGQKELAIPAGGLRVLKAEALGPLAAGAVTVSSGLTLAGVILFGGSLGLAGVGSSEVLSTPFVAPMENNVAQGTSTGIAIMSLESNDVPVDLQLFDIDGKLLASARLDGANILKANGHIARFLTEFAWSPAVDFSNFVGILKVVAGGKVTATVLQVRPAEFATMPVARAVADTSNRQLYFAHFGNGLGQVFSQIMLINLDTSQPAVINISIRNDAGAPLSIALNGELVAGNKNLMIPAGGMRILKTDSLGALTAGAVTVTSDRSLAGVILFGGSIGVAGVGSSLPFNTGFLAPMETNNSAGTSTGVAIMNLESADVTADLQLFDTAGNLISSARLDGANSVRGNGHLSRFLTEFNWNPPVNFLNFSGVLRVTTSGKTTATVLQVRPNQLATMPA
ncbi:MAG TPA: VCBS repeat-containing protein, partial [Acidobacteriota bacterium]|nr:VCBS repeat-containing protein [Acidobacteriota bacterium]